MMSETWNPNDLVYRQVHPSHAPDGTPSSQAFNPTPKDEGQLSVDDAGFVTAEGSWNHFTNGLGFKSIGTWALSVEEIETAEGLKLIKSPVVDADNPEKNNPAHCLLDFNDLESKGERKRRAQKLAIKASARGCQFNPPA
jgi:hypothetical protein